MAANIIRRDKYFFLFDVFSKPFTSRNAYRGKASRPKALIYRYIFQLGKPLPYSTTARWSTTMDITAMHFRTKTLIYIPTSRSRHPLSAVQSFFWQPDRLHAPFFELYYFVICRVYAAAYTQSRPPLYTHVEVVLCRSKMLLRPGFATCAPAER